MPKPYELRLYTGVAESLANSAEQKFVISLTRYAQNWRRSIRRMGGFWQGSFRITGSARALQQSFETWLGYHVEERAGGVVSWEGMVYEMDLNVGGIRRRRSLDMMWNAVKATYTDTTYSGDNCVNNASFEDAGNTHEFAGWYEDDGDAPGDVERVSPGTGGIMTYCCEITSNGENDNTGNPAYVRQNINVTPGGKYRLKFKTKTDASLYPLYYRVRDPNAGEDPISLRSTGWRKSTWTTDNQRITAHFTGPGDGEVLIMFYGHCSNPDLQIGLGTAAYVDDVELLEELPNVFDLPFWPDGVQRQSIDRYGMRELVIHMDEYPLATSTSRQRTFLAENAWPWPRPVSSITPGEATLDIQVAGYCHTLNWLYIMAGQNGYTGNISDWIASIAGSEYGLSWMHNPINGVTDAGDCQFIKAGNIATNTLQVTQQTGVEERPWDMMLELTNLGGVSGSAYIPYRIFVDTGRLLHYRPLYLAPVYYLRPDGVVTALGAATPANPWNVKPAVFRDMSYRAGSEELGSFLDNSQYFYADEVEMADGWSQPSLRTSVISESDLIEAQLQNRPVEMETLPYGGND